MLMLQLHIVLARATVLQKLIVLLVSGQRSRAELSGQWTRTHVVEPGVACLSPRSTAPAPVAAVAAPSPVDLRSSRHPHPHKVTSCHSRERHLVTTIFGQNLAAWSKPICCTQGNQISDSCIINHHVIGQNHGH